jgi:putative ABC transport system permease protein
MFGRLLWKLLRSNRGRLAVALVAVTSGAAVISALLTVELDISRKLTREFRLLGPNVVVSADATSQGATGAAPPALIDEQAVFPAVRRMVDPDIVAVVPYLYSVVQINHMRVVAAGTTVREAVRSEPTWKITGSVPTGEQHECGVGRNVAREFGLSPGSRFQISYGSRTESLVTAFVVDSGGPEDNQVIADLQLVESLIGVNGIELMQLRVDGTSQQVADVVAKLATALPQYDVKPIRQVSEAEGNLLNRTRLLVFSMVVLILALTALCVLATMAALATERRADVGLMKALGGTIARILGLFLAELGVLGAAGGLIGCAAGVVLAEWIGRRVFGSAIAPRWEIFPLTIALMIVVAMAGALPLQRLGKVKPAVILRGE